MDTDAQLEQIEKIAQNARTTWFGLLALLVFVGVTLMGHKDADFFAFGAATQLPLVGIEVPPTAFFVAAPILTAAVFCYLHVYLLGLWEALGRIDQNTGDPPLSDRVFPILFTLSALWWRNRCRQDGCIRERALGRWTLTIAIGMGWGFGWLILFLCWWRSMALHHEGLTLLIGACFWIALFFGAHGLWAAHSYLRDRDYQHIRHFSMREFGLTTLLLLAVSAVGWLRTEGGLEEYMDAPWFTSEDTAHIIPLYPANLAEAELTRKPADWLGFEDWKKEYTLAFRKRYDLGPKPEDWDAAYRDELAEEIPERWQALTASLDKISLRGADLRGARASQAFFAGADLREARLTNAVLEGARLEGAVLDDAHMNKIDLHAARLQAASFRRARMNKADLFEASAANSDFSETNLDDATLFSIQLQDATLRRASLTRVSAEGADFTRAQLESADFSGAYLWGSVLKGSYMHAANFTDAILNNADLRDVEVRYRAGEYEEEGPDDAVSFIGASLTEADLSGSDISSFDIERAWGHCFTVLPGPVDRPAHWSDIGPTWFDREDSAYEKWRASGSPPSDPSDVSSC